MRKMCSAGGGGGGGGGLAQGVERATPDQEVVSSTLALATS